MGFDARDKRARPGICLNLSLSFRISQFPHFPNHPSVKVNDASVSSSSPNSQFQFQMADLADVAKLKHVNIIPFLSILKSAIANKCFGKQLIGNWRMKMKMKETKYFISKDASLSLFMKHQSPDRDGDGHGHGHVRLEDLEVAMPRRREISPSGTPALRVNWFEAVPFSNGAGSEHAESLHHYQPQ